MYTCTPHTYVHRALQQAVVGCGSSFEPFITADLLQLIFSALKHTNRFIRETGFKVLAAIVKCPGEVLIELYCICMRIYLCCLDVLIIISWHYNLMIIAYLKTRMKWDIVIHPSPLQLCTNIQHLLPLHQKWCTIKLLVGKQWIAERSNQPLAHLRVMNIYSLYT